MWHVQFKVDTQDEAIKTLTSAKERLEKEKHKLGEFLGQKSDYWFVKKQGLQTT